MNIQHLYLTDEHIAVRRHEATQQHRVARLERARVSAHRAQRLAGRAEVAADRIT